ncbi:MAG: glycosyltransferase family 4 protein [candidate division FCPU426 bacterium]
MSQGPGGYVGRAMRSLAKYTAGFVCISDYVRQLVESYGVPADQCRLIHCGTQTAVKKEFPSPLREDLEIPIDMPVAGTTGIWRPNKGFPYFIAACELVYERNPWARFLLGGKAYAADNAFATSLWMRGRNLRTLGVLKYTGFMEDIGRFLSALDVFVLPSDCEPFGLVLIEAMARGIPVVATRAGGVPEIVVHGETGLLVTPQSPEAMADAVAFLLANPLERHQMGENARMRVQQHFDRRLMMRTYEALYRQTAREKGRPAA